jgi:hypothetical protein
MFQLRGHSELLFNSNACEISRILCESFLVVSIERFGTNIRILEGNCSVAESRNTGYSTSHFMKSSFLDQSFMIMIQEKVFVV